MYIKINKCKSFENREGVLITYCNPVTHNIIWCRVADEKLFVDLMVTGPDPVLSTDNMVIDYQVTQKTTWVKFQDQEEFNIVDIYLLSLTFDWAQWFKSLPFRIWKETAAGYDHANYTGQDFLGEENHSL